MFERKFSYDIEVYPKYFLFVAKLWQEDKWVIIQDRERMLAFWKNHNTPDWLWMGYNCHSYDDLVIRWFLYGGNPYELSKRIIDGSERRIPYEISRLFKYYSYDAFTRVVDKDMSFGVSLKTLEAYMGVSIEECSVPFDLQRELTKEEKADVIHYCKSDVINTERVIELQEKLTADLSARIGLCEQFNRPELSS